MLSSDLIMFGDLMYRQIELESSIQVQCGERKSICNSYCLDRSFGTSATMISGFGI